MGRVLAVGLDSVDEADLSARLDAGSMPELAALRERGTWCSLTVDPVCRAEYPWTTFVTGRSPKALGARTTVEFDPATYTYRSAGAPDVPPFWSLGDEVSVVSLDVPCSTLARGSSSAHIVDWATHEPGFPRSSSPPDLLVDIDELVGVNPAKALEYAGTWHDGTWLERNGAALLESVRLRTEVVEHLLAAAPAWRLGVVIYGEPHQVAHHAWHGVAPSSVMHETATAATGRKLLDDLHAALDDALGRLASRLDPEDVLVVFSPKGNEAICDLPSNALVPELFHRLAFGTPFLTQPADAADQPPIVLGPGVDYATALRAYVRQPPAGARAVVRRGLGGVARRLRRAAPESAWTPPDPDDLAPIVEDLVFDEWFVATWYRPHWPEMPHFVLPSFSDLHVRINVAGRERDGIVDPADYRRACDAVEEVVRACRSLRTGHGLVADVVRPRGDDPFAVAGLAADVVVSWAEDTDALVHPDVGAVGPYPAWRVGGHGARAFALVVGGDIGPGHVAGAPLVDLPATLLDLAGVAPATVIDGVPIGLPHRQPTA